MEEVIMKSKFFKTEKAREKEENEKLVDQLDKDFESLVHSQAISSLTQPDKLNALKALVNPNFNKDLNKKEVTFVSKNSNQEPDSYDKLVAEMGFEICARPSDRTKTPEEITEDEKERLKELETEKAREKEENEKVVDQLDKDFESLVHSQAISSLTQPDKLNALKALVNPNFNKDLNKKEVTFVSKNSNQEPDSYDKLVAEMGFEIRARPSDRTKTPEEINEDEKERLKELETEKAREKEENEKVVDQLDKDFESLVQSQAISSLTQPDKLNALKALVNPNFNKDLNKKEVTFVSKNSNQEPDSYDKLVAEMGFEIRARPSDRTKTPEEIPEDEKERLKELETEKAREKEENEKVVDQLDKNFESLVHSQAISSLTQPDKLNALKALVNPNFNKDLNKKEVTFVSKNSNQEPDSYDKLVAEMRFEIRARPSDRTKTPEEITEDEKERLKELKTEKAREKEENEKVVDQLDKDFESLVHSQAISSLTQPDKLNALKALVNPNFNKDLNKKEVTFVSKNSNQEPDSYDKLVAEMGFEIRARPSDRTKTPEEIAEDEKERLKELEEERQKRMLATDDASDEDNDSEDDGSQSAKKFTHILGDDLGDYFTIDEKPQIKKGWVDKILERKDADNEDGESSEDSGDTEDDDDDNDDDDDDEKVETLRDWEHGDERSGGKKDQVAGTSERGKR